MSGMQWKQVISPSFVVACVVLLVSALALNRVVAMNRWVLQKQPIALRRPLELMPDRFGPYELVRKEPRLSSEVEDVLGTTQYITWEFKDTRLKENEPGAVIRLHVPYYTGTIDTVPHVPDRCFVGGGAQVVTKEISDVELASPRIETGGAGVRALTGLGQIVTLPGATVPLSVVEFADPQRPTAEGYCATYFFIANNRYVPTPEGVRLAAFNLRERYAYYCKVEVLPMGVSKMEDAAKVAGDFLSYALPEIMACLPDWQQLTGEDSSSD